MTPKFLLYTFSIAFAAGNGFKVEAASEEGQSMDELVGSGNLPRPFTAPQRHELQQELLLIKPETLAEPPQKQHMLRRRPAGLKTSSRRMAAEVNKEECPDEHLEVKEVSDCCCNGCCEGGFKICVRMLALSAPVHNCVIQRGLEPNRQTFALLPSDQCVSQNGTGNSPFFNCFWSNSSDHQYCLKVAEIDGDNRYDLNCIVGDPAGQQQTTNCTAKRETIARAQAQCDGNGNCWVDKFTVMNQFKP